MIRRTCFLYMNRRQQAALELKCLQYTLFHECIYLVKSARSASASDIGFIP